MARPADSANQWRYERKFLISELTRHEIELLVRLHPAIFVEIYHRRFVNNIYFDSLNMKSYFDNSDGLRNRRKVRIRWYGDLFGFIEKPVLELKHKNGLLGRKESYPLPPFSISPDFRPEGVVEAFKKAEIPEVLRMDMLSLQPTLLNRYSRRYFQSASRNYRITIDSDMEFYRIDLPGSALLEKSVDMANTILELKYDRDNDRNAATITNFFPFRLSKNSKYAGGVERLYA
jgi:SPX domain protein involved in polyphosphate accumulation